MKVQALLKQKYPNDYASALKFSGANLAWYIDTDKDQLLVILQGLSAVKYYQSVACHDSLQKCKEVGVFQDANQFMQNSRQSIYCSKEYTRNTILILITIYLGRLDLLEGTGYIFRKRVDLGSNWESPKTLLELSPYSASVRGGAAARGDPASGAEDA